MCMFVVNLSEEEPARTFIKFCPDQMSCIVKHWHLPLCLLVRLGALLSHKLLVIDGVIGLLTSCYFNI